MEKKFFFSPFALPPCPYWSGDFWCSRSGQRDAYGCPFGRLSRRKTENITEKPPVGAFIQELLNVGLYKRSQGRITRQVTFAAMAVIFAIGFYRMHQILLNQEVGAKLYGMAYWLPGILVLSSWWICYRLVNLPSFADFLIAVEAELNKVSWPTRTELVRSSIVVLISLLLLAGVIFGFDLIWKAIFSWLGVIG
jgi:preprotein translocase subunit SecE